MAQEASRRQRSIFGRRTLTSMQVPRPSGEPDWPDKVNAPGTERDDEEEEDRKATHSSWLWLLLTAGPLLVAVVLLGIIFFGSDIQSSTFLLHLSGAAKGPELWLALSGYCLDSGKATNCSISPLNTFYEKAYKSSALDMGKLEKYLPQNLSTDASLLLVSLITIGVSVAFIAWASFDMRKAAFLAREERRSWVHEWLQARRLELLGVFFAATAVACGMAAASDLTAQIAAANATVNAMAGDAGSDLTRSEIGSAITLLYSAQACVGFTILLETFLLAYDGLMRRLRFEYESLIDDLDAFSRDDFVVLQTRLNKMHALTLLKHQVQTPEHKEQIRQYLLAYVQRHHVDHILRRQKALIMAQEAEFFKLQGQAMQTLAPYTRKSTAGPPPPFSMPAY